VAVNPYLRLLLRLRGESHGEGGDPISLTAPRLRRALGKALIVRFCPFGEPRCQAQPPAGGRRPAPRDLCRLAEDCPYGVLFAASRSPRPPFALHVPHDFGMPPRPSLADTHLEVTLYGPAWSLYLWALWAIKRACYRGLGTARRRWSVEEVSQVRPDGTRDRLCAADLRELPATLEPDEVVLRLDPAPPPRPVEVTLLSPARLLRDGRILPGLEPIPLDLLVARILDRFRGLYGDHASELLQAERRSKVEAEAAEVPLLTDETHWFEARDPAARTRSEMLLGGKVGRLVYPEAAARFFSLLKAGEILHLGKNVASGCGRIQVIHAEGATVPSLPH